ncbi:uncharacterized protein LOC101460651 isoform X2 [Ceratitis capitata]|uniref:uncharacterized protein LOC101460651 isoform X2 n=1 Tax=Ceratitis capitata TaxID=7213 RepID=UPI000329A874|nr:uncharacterized protein LOC101460651 isoform X2 [Ceratitis capitata]
MSADSPRRQSRGITAPAIVPPQVVSDRSILDSAFGFISDVTLVTHQSHTEPKDTIIWARFETAADISDPCFGVDWEIEGNVAPPLLLLLGYGLGVQVWAIPANGEAVEVLSWRHGVVSTLRILPTPTQTRSANEHGRADEKIDIYADKRPIIALVDSSTACTQMQFCTMNFVSLKTGKQIKTIKFKNPVLDIFANRSSVVVVFHERIAVFDASTLEDRLSITTCYPSPGINPNPVALGQRWLAYAEQRLIPSKRSGGGWDGEGIASYTATVLNAAKSFGKGLRELGEQVAAGLTGTSSSGSISKNNSFDSNSGIEAKQAGIVTIMDIEKHVKEYSPTTVTPASGVIGDESIIAHFIAHSEAIVAMEFDNSGMLLLTADRRGHDFHVFRVQPHPVSPSLSAVHHLYVLHRGDTSAKVQNITFSLDSRWVAISTLRGTTHVFPITPYGGPMGVRTHTSLHVVNKLSRFHRSAGLSAEGRSNSPISHSDSTSFMQSLQPYHNTTLPPFPRPTVVLPLAQLRQPFALGSPPGSAGLVMPSKIGVNTNTPNATQRQRHSSLSDDNGKPLSVCAIFAKSRSWLLEPPNITREASHRVQRKSVDSLFVMAGHGALIQYDLDTKLASNIAKDKICDDTPIELEVEAKAQWNLGRRRDGSHELAPPLEKDNWLLRDRNSCLLDSLRQYDDLEEKSESWVSQVEIITHAGPHRRLWMGPQCVFKTYNTPSGSNLNHVDVEAVEIGVSKPASAASTPRSHPLSMPVTAAARCALPVLIESGSYSSIEQSPKLMDRFRHEHLDSDFAMAHGDSRLKEDLADAMRESPSVSEAQKITCRLASEVASFDNVSFYDARTDPDIGDDDTDFSLKSMLSNPSSLGSASETVTTMSDWNLVSDVEAEKCKKPQLFSNALRKHSEFPKSSTPSVEKVVNPLGTVTTIISGNSTEMKRDILDEVASQLAAEEIVIHENCDESLFRPVVTIFCDDKKLKRAGKQEALYNEEFCKPPEPIKDKLIVPVIAKEIDAALSKKEKDQNSGKVKTKNFSKLSKPTAQSKKPTQETLNHNANKMQDKIKCDPDQTLKTFPENNKSAGTEKTDLTENKIGSVKTKKHVKKMPTSDEEPIEFKRMTPLPITKTRNQQSLVVGGECSKFESSEDLPITECKDPPSLGLRKAFKKEMSYKEDNIQSKSEDRSLDEKSDEFPTHENEVQNISLSPNVIQSKESIEKPEHSSSVMNSENICKEMKSLCLLSNEIKGGEVDSELEIKTAFIKKPCDKEDNNEASTKKMQTSSNKNININDITESPKSKASKSIDLDKVKKQNNSPTIKSPEIKVSQIVNNKSNEIKKSDVKQCSVLRPSAEKEFLQEQGGIKKITQSECCQEGKGVIESKITKVEDSKVKISKTKSSSDYVFEATLKETTPIISKESAKNFEAIGAERTEQKTYSTYLKDVMEIKECMQSNSENCENLRVSSPKNSVWRTANIEDRLESIKSIDNYPSLGTTGKSKKSLKTKEVVTEQKISIDADSYTEQKPCVNYSSLGAISKTKKSAINENSYSKLKLKLIENIQCTEMSGKTNDKKGIAEQSKGKQKALEKLDTGLKSDENKYIEGKWASSFDGLSSLQPLETLPPLPTLDHLDMHSYSAFLKEKENKSSKKTKDNTNEQFSLINFDSPLQEDPRQDHRVISPSGRLSEQNIIFALCGSLHYENEDYEDKSMDYETTSKSELREQPMPEYKLLNENEEQYLSLEHSSQETNTTNTVTTNEKSSSSANSSTSEEIVIIEEKKLSKKQRRKRQTLEGKHQIEEAVGCNDDEELCPLIGVTKPSSEIEGSSSLPTFNNINVHMLNDNIVLRPDLVARSSPTTTTDSEGPIPATTSDENIFILPTNVANNNAPTKLKTKRLEHKINLMAAIDAATSSSTSSAEEGNVEADSRKAGSDQELPSLGASISPVQIISTNVNLVTPSCTTKKKTKRRKR